MSRGLGDVYKSLALRWAALASAASRSRMESEPSPVKSFKPFKYPFVFMLLSLIKNSDHTRHTCSSRIPSFA
ncbi:hypothetical protein ACVGWV_16385, partial [Enterobacter asburiae]